MTDLATYARKYQYVSFRREDGILEMKIHRDGGPALWDSSVGGIHGELGDAFYDVARDRENKVVIFTGTGDVFLDRFDFSRALKTPTTEFWDRIFKEGRDLLHNLLDIEVPVISAINGNAYIHAELPLLSDLVIMADHARFADKVHFPSGVVPGDGVHVLWTMWLGPNHGRYFLMTGQEIDGAEALRLGLVGEVVPAEKLLPRAWALARDVMSKPELARRYTRLVLTQHLKHRLLNDLGHGLMAEGMGILARGDIK